MEKEINDIQTRINEIEKNRDYMFGDEKLNEELDNLIEKRTKLQKKLLDEKAKNDKSMRQDKELRDYIYDYTINGTSQIADGSHFITGARTTGTLTASGTEIKITVTAKRLYTLTWPKLANSYFHTTVYGYRNSTNGTKQTILTAGTTQKTATIFEDEEI